MAEPRRVGGRPGSVEEARELVTLVSSLSEAGDALDAGAVASRLGVSQERAEKLLSLVLTARTTSGSGLPLTEDDGMLALVTDDGTRGRALRLTRPETLALVAALDRLGVGGDDPLRARLESALSADPVDEGLARRVVDARADDGAADALAVCARALARRRDLAFSYRRLDETEATERTVRPRGLRCEDGAWLLDALDLGRAGERTFRVDRMDDVRETEPGESPVAEPDEGHASGRTVSLTFSDPSYLELLPWHELDVEPADADGTVRARTPWYGGSWLVRMVAACGGTCVTDDPELAARVRELAEDALA